MKTLPISISQSLYKNALLQISASLYRALAPKPFEIQAWGWSRTKDSLKIFESDLTENS